MPLEQRQQENKNQNNSETNEYTQKKKPFYIIALSATFAPRAPTV